MKISQPCYIAGADFGDVQHWAIRDLPAFEPIGTHTNSQNIFKEQIIPQSTAEQVFGADVVAIYSPRVAQYANLIEAAAAKYNVPAQIIGNIIQAESAGDSKAYRGYGENSRGLMQITEATARDMGYTGAFDNLYDPATNIDLGVKLLSYYRDMEWPYFSADTPMVDRWKIIASAYNQGPGYGLNALKQLNAQGKSTTWDVVLDYMISNPLPTTGKTPIARYANSYGPKAVGEMVESDFFTPGRIGLLTLIIIGVGSYFLFKKLREKGHFQQIQFEGATA